jgi:hypothetical protein
VTKTEALLIAAQAELLKREAAKRGLHELADRAQSVVGTANLRASA